MIFYQFEQPTEVNNIDYQLCFMVPSKSIPNVFSVFNSRLLNFSEYGNVNPNRLNSDFASGFMFRNNFKYEDL